MKVDMLAALRTFWKKALVIVAVGIVLALLMSLRSSYALKGGGIIPDTLFTVAMVFLFVGIGNLAGNMGAFNSFKYGAICLSRIWRGKHETPEEMKDGYAAYVKSRPKHKDIWLLLACALLFFALSVAVWLIMEGAAQ